MKITINSIETRTSATKGDYAYGKATINKKDNTTRDVTVMSFGKQFESVREMLVEGTQVEVNAVFDKGVLKILSPYTPKADNDADAGADMANAA